MIQLTNRSVQEFERMLDEGAEVVSIGAGQALQTLCKKYEKLTNCLCYAADNYKTGFLDLNGCAVPIRKMDQCEPNGSTIFLIPSLQYAVEMIEQLDRIPHFNGVKVYVPALFSDEDNTEEPEPDVFQQGTKQLIPKMIHYCWFGGKELPEKFQRNIETWRRNCPDYEIIRWDESNYDINKNLYMKQAYERKYWGFVSDYARLDIINTYGGIYLDTDVELLKPLDVLLQFKLYCGFESKDYVNFGLGFGSQKSSPILEDIMDLYNQMTFIASDGSLNLTACPKYQTEVLTAHGLKKNGKTQITEEFAALSPIYLNPVNFRGVGQPAACTFSIHQYAATWYTEEQQCRKEKTEEIVKYILERMRY